MDDSMRGRRATVLFPQSIWGIAILYLVFVGQTLMYVFKGFTLPDGSMTSDPDLRMMIGILIDTVIGVGANLVVIWFVRWLLVKFNVLEVKSANKTRFLLFVGVLAAVLVVFSVAIPVFANINFRQESSKNGATQESAGPFKSSSLTPDEQSRIKMIIENTMRGPEPVSKDLHVEFWGYLIKGGEGSAADVANTRMKMTALVTEYMPLYWQDAAASFDAGKVIKSEELKRVEARLLKEGILKPELAIRNDDDLAKIAAKEPLIRNGQKILITKENIQGARDNVDGARARVELLFSPPSQ